VVGVSHWARRPVLPATLDLKEMLHASSIDCNMLYALSPVSVVYRRLSMTDQVSGSCSCAIWGRTAHD